MQEISSISMASSFILSRAHMHCFTCLRTHNEGSERDSCQRPVRHIISLNSSICVPGDLVRMRRASGERVGLMLVCTSPADGLCT